MREEEKVSEKILYVAGIGPGGREYMTEEAFAALREADVIAGYSLYADLVRPHFPDKEYLVTGMRKERERCLLALQSASEGKRTVLISGGDAAVYGMAGLVLELAEDFPEVDVQVIAGVTAALAGSAVLGAPLGHDFCCISLSDILTPWETVARRLRCAAEGGFVMALYNPGSRKRTCALENAADILLEILDPDTVCGYVRQIGRDGTESGIMTLSELKDFRADMLTTVFIGNAETIRRGRFMITPRGYRAEEKETKR